MEEKQIENRLEKVETQLREIFNALSKPTENLNLMQLRVAAYRKINTAVEQLDKVLEMIETEFITDIDPKNLAPSVIYLNQQRESEHNEELQDILTAIREIRWILISPPENYQNEPVAV